MKSYLKTAFIFAIQAMIISLVMCSGGNKEWAAKVNEQDISIEELNRYYYTHHKLLLNVETNADVDKIAADPSGLRPEIQQSVMVSIQKKNYLDSLIAQKLLYNKAMKDSKIDKLELETILEVQKLQFVGNYYLNKILKDEINVTQDEIDKFYEANRERLRQVPILEANERIKSHLLSQKFAKKSGDYVKSLVDGSNITKKGFVEYEEKALKDSEKAKDDKKQDKVKSSVEKTKEPEKK